MITPWNCKRKQPIGLTDWFARSDGNLRSGGSAGRSLWFALILTMIVPAGGCYSGGELLYVMGFWRGQKIEAKFLLTEEPILILIDDASERVDWPPTMKNLFDDLAQELLRNEAARKIIPAETLAGLRHSVPGFEKRGCREIGELAGAHQVIWIEVQDFLATKQVEEVTTAAYFTATVKVIDATEKERRSRVRVWPSSPQGRLVTVSMTGSEAGLARTRADITKELANRLAVAIAKLFYDYRLGDFEREE